MILRPPPRVPLFPRPFLEALRQSRMPVPVQVVPFTAPARRSRSNPSVDPLPYLQGLQRLLPPSQVELILRQTGRLGHRTRRLPPAAVLWLVLGMGLVAQPSIPKIWRAFHPSTRRDEPTDSAFSQARRRLGVPPLRMTFDRIARPMATPLTPGA